MGEYYCEFCKKLVDYRFKWKIAVNYGSVSLGNVRASKNTCMGCIIEKFTIEKDKLHFLMELCEFRRNIGKYSRDEWTKKEIALFATILESKNIEIKDYDIPLFSYNVQANKPDFYLHRVFGLPDNVHKEFMPERKVPPKPDAKILKKVGQFFKEDVENVEKEKNKENKDSVDDETMEYLAQSGKSTKNEYIGD